MNIGFLIDDITQEGGTERVTSMMCNGLCEFYDKITIYTLAYNKENPAFYFNESIELCRVHGYNRHHRILKVLNDIRKGKVERLMVISMGRLSFEVGILSLILGVSKKIIFCEHVSFQSFPPIIQNIKALTFKTCRKVVVLTNNDHSYLIEKYNLKNIVSVPNINPFDGEIIERQRGSQKKIAITVGRFTAQKNFIALLDIWKKSNLKGWELWLIGDGELLTDYIKFINDNGMDNIKIMPFTSKIIDIYTQASLFLMTSIYEGLPMVLIESQCCGVPAIAYNCLTGPDEIIVNNETGFIIDIDDEYAFISKLRYLANNEAVLSDFQHNAIKGSFRFSRGKIISVWKSIIEDSTNG